MATPFTERLITRHFGRRACGPRPVRIRRTIILDVDKTLTESGKFAATRTFPFLEEFSERTGLPHDLVLEPHLDFPMRHRVHDIGFLVPAACMHLEERGESCSVQPGKDTERAMAHYRHTVLEQEADMELCPGVAEGLEELAAEPGTVIFAHTDCPDWLALRRLSDAGLLRHIWGLIAIAPRPPANAAGSAYRDNVHQCMRWVHNQIEQTSHGLEFMVSVPQDHAKPCHLGLAYAYNHMKLDPSSCGNLSCGDNLDKEGLVAQKLRAGTDPRFLDRMKFVLADYGREHHSGDVLRMKPNVTVDGVIHNFTELPGLVAQLLVA